MIDNRPKLLDLFCGAGGASMGYYRAGFEVYGIDNKPQKHYHFPFLQMDATEAMDRLLRGEGLTFSNGETLYLSDFSAYHASPPCQGYSIMHNLPWLRGREYPLLILPTIELLESLGKPYVLENVMGARHGAKGLKKRGLEAHGLKAGWLCGAMFGLPFYRHRLFATNWFWLAPGHPKHQIRIRPGQSLAGRARDIVFSQAEDSRGIKSWPNRRGEPAGLAVSNTGLDRRFPDGSRQSIAVGGALANWQGNGAQVGGIGIGHAKGWRLAAEAMGIDWMKREELTQAIPPAYTEYIGKYLLEAVK